MSSEQRSNDPLPTPELITEQLRRILVSPHFIASERLRKFLRYIVEETLAGRQDRIKGFTIAMEVFGRGDDFDAQNDPVVRIEAGRLRRALEHYYLATGRDALVVIDIPKGGYVPTFAPPATLGAELAPEGASSRRNDLATVSQPSIAVLPFSVLGESTAAPLYAASLTEELIAALSRFREMRIFRVQLNHAGPSHAGMEAALGKATYRTEGAVRASDGTIRVDCRLLNSANGAVIWGEVYKVPLAVQELVRLPAELAGRIAQAIAQPYGAIFRSEAVKAHQSAPDDINAYLGTLGFYLYRSDLSAERHLTLRDTLELIVRRYPDYATAWAMLGYVYLDEDRFGFNRRPGEPARKRALDCARTAVRLDPQDARALQSLMIALVFNGQPEEALSITEVARALNPNDTELLGQIGQIVGLLGRWEEGRDMLERALELNPGHTGIYHDNLALAHYMLGDLDSARIEIETGDQIRLPLHHAIATIIYAELGLMERASAALKLLQQGQPNFVPDLWSELERRCLPVDAQERIAGSLRRAGAPVPGRPAR